MRTVNMHHAKTHLSRLVRDAVAGEPFIIARAGKPLVRVSAVELPSPKSRLGFLAGQFRAPEDIDAVGAEEIQALFEGGAEDASDEEDRNPGEA